MTGQQPPRNLPGRRTDTGHAGRTARTAVEPEHDGVGRRVALALLQPVVKHARRPGASKRVAWHRGGQAARRQGGQRVEHARRANRATSMCVATATAPAPAPGRGPLSFAGCGAASLAAAARPWQSARRMLGGGEARPHTLRGCRRGGSPSSGRWAAPADTPVSRASAAGRERESARARVHASERDREGERKRERQKRTGRRRGRRRGRDREGQPQQDASPRDASQYHTPAGTGDRAKGRVPMGRGSTSALSAAAKAEAEVLRGWG